MAVRFQLVFVIVCLLSACTIHYDELHYYNEDYAPNNKSIRTNGFYYKASTSAAMDWPQAVNSMYFFKSGSFKVGATSESIEALETNICKNGDRYYSYGPYGFYKVQQDTMYVEYVVTDPMGDHHARRYELKAVPLDSGILVFERNGAPRSEFWRFQESICVPDSVYNWLQHHRKYKLK